MTEERQNQIDIPESIDSYKITLFWGLTTYQIILVFVATLFIGFGIFNAFARHIVTAISMFLLTTLPFFGIFEIQGRNFYRHVLFILSYYRTKPKVLIYHHFTSSGLATIRQKQLIYQKENNKKLLIILTIIILVGIVLLILTAYYLYHVTHT